MRNKSKSDLVKIIVCSGSGAAVGATTASSTGLTAAGLVGAGIGIGCSAIAFGAGIGALGALSLYGIYRLFR